MKFEEVERQSQNAARNECVGRNVEDMDLERNRFVRERASFVYLYTHTRSKGAAVTRKANQRPAEWPQRREEDRKRKRDRERERRREREREGDSGERVTGHVIGSTRCSRDRPRDVTRTCRIAW